MRRAFMVLAAFAALVVLAAPATSQEPGDPNPGVVPYSDQYRDLSEQWWKWVFSLPLHSNPLFDSTGEWAANGQSPDGAVFFIGGAMGAFLPDGSVIPPPYPTERTITISSHTKLFLPILNTEWDNIGVHPPLSVPALRALAAVQVAHYTQMYASIDGVSVVGLDGDPMSVPYRTVSGVFRYAMPAEDNLVEFFYGLDMKAVQPVVGDGVYLLLKPLPVGQHTIEFGGIVDFMPDWQFVESVIYHVNVVE